MSTDQLAAGAPVADGAQPSVTTWTRLEPRTRREDMSPSLEARTADPLWLLARQWQFGEFTGEDAGSPVAARVHAEVAAFTRYRPGGRSGSTVPMPSGVPLEALVERETAATADDLRFAAETGQHFLRLLAAAGAGSLASAIIDRFRIPEVPVDAPSATDPATAGYLRLVAGRVPHGDQVLRACADGSFLTEVEVPEALRETVRTVIAEWLAWLGVPDRPAGPPAGYLLQLPAVISPGVDPRPQTPPWPAAEFHPVISTPGLEGSAWQRERLEHEFAIGAAGSAGEVVLTAHEYDGDRLDWYHFDHEPDETLQSVASVEDVVRITLPTPVSYAGMPAVRFWEMEDSRVNLAQIGASAGDLARMFLMEYGLVYANDHFLVPLELPVGSATRIRSLIVTDTFGGQTLVPPAPGGRGWALFRPASAATGDPADVLVLPATVAATTDSEPVEEVRFGRDEMANLAWAIERTVTGATGRGIDRTAQVGRAAVPERPAVPPAVDPVTGQPVNVPDASYAFATTVPENWVPLLPKPFEGDPTSVRLHRVPLQQPTRDGEPIAVTGHSRVLDWRTRSGGTELVELAIPEEEVPRAGARVVRQWQLARWTDGSVHLWLGRAKHTGGGEASSGLRYDVVEHR
ncbi:hypothetical protein GCM10027280_54440 [Micromonospora polyrhachis]|uniref:Uncharacterized protein n=1 Tax=Micromonospora polyrhachis TaxID=1282883 RepID=A0A7W7WSC0_9ACTN|nr:hypothetical protein [Micromonospora polyrhachis]MBB4961834.1 hypothetical protein [Micromonospora polyrhachis]